MINTEKSGIDIPFNNNELPEKKQCVILFTSR